MLDIAPVQDALQRVGDSLRAKSAINVGAVKPISDAASYVASNFGQRAAIVAAFEPPVWTSFAALWPALATALDPAATSDEAGTVAAATAIAKLERNLLAGDATAQSEAILSEPDIRRLVFNVTTFTRIESAEFAELHGVLAQLLCNLVSPREGSAESAALARGVLNVWLSGGRDDDVIIRLLDSRDARANLGVLRLLLNLATTRELEQLLSPVAIRWLAQILGRMDDWHTSSTHETCFDVGVALFARFFNAGLQERIFDALKAPDEEITPSQTTLLKLLDAHLARAVNDVATTANPSPSPNSFVIPVWRGLAAYATQSMRSGQDDARLPGILAALVLATEILAGVVLAAQARADKRLPPGGDGDMVAEMKGEASVRVTADDASIIPLLVDVLRATNEFLPRIKPTPTTPAENAALAAGMSLPEVQHRFANVKRDLVRLLAVLAYNDVRVGDMVREAGGVHLVLALCETDERNSYLREHALFAVRNLMTGNPANQAIIAEMDPLGVVGDDGELKPLPEHLKRSNDRAVAAGRDASASAGGSNGTGGASGASMSEI